jgi:hypothetical protein
VIDRDVEAATGLRVEEAVEAGGFHGDLEFSGLGVKLSGIEQKVYLRAQMLKNKNFSVGESGRLA